MGTIASIKLKLKLSASTKPKLTESFTSGKQQLKLLSNQAFVFTKNVTLPSPEEIRFGKTVFSSSPQHFYIEMISVALAIGVYSHGLLVRLCTCDAGNICKTTMSPVLWSTGQEQKLQLMATISISRKKWC